MHVWGRSKLQQHIYGGSVFDHVLQCANAGPLLVLSKGIQRIPRASGFPCLLGLCLMHVICHRLFASKEVRLVLW
jgi:hypothetical protein